jgi:radical SAM protein with 4Fe4S-binding SPASM domain
MRFKPNFLLQWHITDRCNLRCRHCYQSNHSAGDLPLDALLSILDQYKVLLSKWRIRSKHRALGHINITGGEPFLRADFFPFLERLRRYCRLFTFSILTNGHCIDRQTAQHLKQLAPRYIQVSLEGSPACHDQIRGQGSYCQTVSAIKHLVKAGIPTLMSFTAHKMNVGQFAHVAQLGRQLGVTKIWADRLIPAGRGAALMDQTLDAQETWRFFIAMDQERLRNNRRTQIAMHRALQFLVSGQTPYACTAGDSLICVLANGDLVPCRRMPIVVGNVLQSPMDRLYDQSEIFRMLRDDQTISMECRHCRHRPTCRGGLRCLSYSIYNDPFRADPGCWVARAYPSAAKTTNNDQGFYEYRKSFTEISQSASALS